VDGWMDGWVDGWMDGWMDGWVDRWILGGSDDGMMDYGIVWDCNVRKQISAGNWSTRPPLASRNLVASYSDLPNQRVRVISALLPFCPKFKLVLKLY